MDKCPGESEFRDRKVEYALYCTVLYLVQCLNLNCTCTLPSPVNPTMSVLYKQFGPSREYYLGAVSTTNSTY